MTQAKLLGDKGEALAARYYEKAGYKIVARNFRTRQGEIDVIVQKGSTLVFVEVKTRTSAAFAAPCEAVHTAKQKRLILAARAYLTQQKGDCFARFDVVEIVWPPQGEAAIHCIENAFEC